MAKSLQSILGFTPLTESLRTQASGVPDVLPSEFFTVDERNRVLGDRAKYIRIVGERRVMLRSKYGAPAVRRSLKDIGDQAVRCLHNFESFPIDLTVMQQLQSFEQYQQDMGMDWLSYQLGEAAKRQKNTRIIAVASTLANGAIYWDSNGQMLPNSSGADTNLTIDWNIPATHKNQINGIIDASWALVNTDIPTHIENMQKFSIQETGMRLTACLYGINIAKYIRQNNFCQAFMSRNPDFNGRMLTNNTIPDGLFGIERWIPAYNTFYEKDDLGTVAEIWSNDLAVFVPNVDQPDKMTWFRMFEGSLPVPRTIDVQRDPLATVKNAEIVYGMGSFAVAGVSPPTVEVYEFDTFLPAIRNEKAPFLATCAF